MRHTVTSSLCALLLAGAVVTAQTTKSTTETKVKSDNGQVVVVIGCVMIGGATNFLLTVTSEREQHEKVASSHAGGSYALIEREHLDLGRYINQTVELTGVVVPAATKSDADDKINIKDTTRVDVEHGPDKKSSATKTVKVARGAATQFVVASVKTLAPVCEQ